MSIFVWNSEIKNAYIWTTPVKEIFVWTTKVRPLWWIYHNPSLWLISLSSDWQTRITIADKNLWATTVYNYGDTFSEANSGKFYKYGNNYWFPYSWWITTNSSLVSNLSGYWPWNYYSNSTGYWNNNHRTDVNYPNLWGYVTWTKSAMQWPCPSWYNVWAANTDNSLMAAINILVNLLWVGSASDITEENLWRYLLLPNCWYRAANGAFGSGTWYLNAGWTSWNSNICYVAITWVNFVWVAGVRVLNYQQWNFYTIRPIKNEAVVPDASRTKLY